MSGPPPSDDGVERTYHRGRRRRKAALAAVVLAAAVLGWRRWRPFRIEIAGDSMAPTLEAGDLALAVRARGVGPGDVVVLEHPERPGFELVKRVVVGPGGDAPDGRALDPMDVWVEGDATERSSDSRTFGPVGTDAVRARVTLVLWPPSNFGPVRVRV